MSFLAHFLVQNSEYLLNEKKKSKIANKVLEKRQRRGSAWPAICDIWLGKRTVPVLAVAKESRGAAALAAIAIWASGGPIDDELRRNFLSGHLSVVCLDVFLPFSK